MSHSYQPIEFAVLARLLECPAGPSATLALFDATITGLCLAALYLLVSKPTPYFDVDLRIFRIKATSDDLHIHGVDRTTTEVVIL